MTGTPSSAQTGTYSNIVVSVIDGLLGKALPAFAIKVAAATWYFAIKADTGSGTQSDFSTQISKTVR